MTLLYPPLLEDTLPRIFALHQPGPRVTLKPFKATQLQPSSMSASPDPLTDVPAPTEETSTAKETTAAEDLVAELSDDESVLSDIDDAQFQDFDAEDVPIEERPQLAIDEENLKLVGRHKRQRTEDDDDAKQKKKKREGRREKKSRRKQRQESDEAFSGGEETGGKRTGRRRDGRAKKVEEVVNEEELDPETRSLLSFPPRPHLKVVDTLGASLTAVL